MVCHVGRACAIGTFTMLQTRSMSEPCWIIERIENDVIYVDKKRKVILMWCVCVSEGEAMGNG
jgi:hypothetical protein